MREIPLDEDQALEFALERRSSAPKQKTPRAKPASRDEGPAKL
jgi:hypothetical protein